MNCYAYVGTYVEKTLDIQELIFRAIKSALDIDTDLLTSKSRKRDIVEARQIFMYLMIKRTHKSLEKIGNVVNRDHSTAIHARKVVENLVETDKEFASKYYTVLNRLDNSMNYRVDPVDGELSETPETVRTFSLKMEKLKELQNQLNNI